MMVTSCEHYKYLIVLCDVASGSFKLIPLYSRHGVYEAIGDWIDEMRSDPLYTNMSYPIVSCIDTDNAGEWGYKNKKWQQLVIDKKFSMKYGCPDRKEEVARGERAVGIAEICIKSLLLEHALPASWWASAAADAEFLLNRFPPISMDVNSSPDGDNASPIEILTRGYVSRRRVHRELSYYVPVGTPCLVHDPKVKGSTIGPKVRWGIPKSTASKTKTTLTSTKQTLTWTSWLTRRLDQTQLKWLLCGREQARWRAST